MIKTAGNRFDPTGPNLYFIAAQPDFLEGAVGVSQNHLCAVDGILTEEAMATCRRIVDADVNLFIDSGVFALTNVHARTHGTSMDEALGLAPEEIDGFDQLFARYIEVCSAIGDISWGYIEFDQGGRENKIKTRTKLEALGLRPIPVYHPINDGWDYFDFLASRYDRICFGNIVQAGPAARVRLLATAFERRRKYPHLWIHVLGIEPNETLFSMPQHSCDSSNWLNAVRWGTVRERACGKRFGDFDNSIIYPYSDGAGQKLVSTTGSMYRKSLRVLAYQAHALTINWRNHGSHIGRIS